MKPYEQTCPACGAPSERVTKKWFAKEEARELSKIPDGYELCQYPLCSKFGNPPWFHFEVTKEHIAFRCEVCGKRWAEEVNPVELTRPYVLSNDEIKALQQALSSEETNASKLVEEAVQKICSMVTENMRLRQVRSSFQDDMCHAGKELRQLRDEVAELRREPKVNGIYDACKIAAETP